MPELHTAVERRLPTKLQADSVGALLLNDLLDIAGNNGQEIDLVCNTTRRLHGSDIGVDEDSLTALLLERLDSLRARVVELSSLSNLQPTRAEYQNLLVAEIRAGLVNRVSAPQTLVLTRFVDEFGEEEPSVLGATSRLRVELHREEGLGHVDQTFVGDVVDVYEVRLPVGGKIGVINSVAVVLRGDVDLVRQHVLDRLVVPTVTELELVGLAARCTRQELVAQADAEDRNILLERPAQVLHSHFTHSWVARTVGDEETVVALLFDIMVPRHHCQLDAS
mmetsp:Transcript_31242/g.45695  ORF Transcript_31242/g.45695 Transcript_31242/m.45695 type:complete len:279 (+) Transcript_31242:3176-4012(+)